MLFFGFAFLYENIIRENWRLIKNGDFHDFHSGELPQKLGRRCQLWHPSGTHRICFVFPNMTAFTIFATSFLYKQVAICF